MPPGLSNEESPLTDTEVHYLHSEHVGDEFKILVGHCDASESAPSAVAFVTDPWAWFGTALEIVRMLNLTRHLPPLLVVGVGYRVTSVPEILRLRRRDFTPTVDLNFHEDTATMGGASRFLSFLRDELKPWVLHRYEVDPDDFALFGGSDGGLFATYVLLSEPTTFRRYGIKSPMLDWDDEFMFEREEAYAQAHDDLPARVFFSVGEYENPEGAKRLREWLRARSESADQGAALEEDSGIVALTARMVESLRGRVYPSLEIECEVLPGEYHDTALPQHLSRSFRCLFDAPR
jgi:predicted alpha/beta superfamily hydrolase